MHMFFQPAVLCPRVDVVCVVHSCLLECVVHSAKRLCESELCCLGHRRKVSVLCLCYKIYRRVDHLGGL